MWFAEQLDTSATAAPLVTLFFLMLLEIIVCYGSLSDHSKTISRVAGIFGMLMVGPFLYVNTLPMWWLGFITVPMVFVKVSVFLDQCSIFGDRSKQAG